MSDGSTVARDAEGDGVTMRLDPDRWSDKDIDPDVMGAAIAWLDGELEVLRSSPEPLVRTDRAPTPIAHGGGGDAARTPVRTPGVVGNAALTAFMLGLFNVAIAFDGLLVARIYALGFLLVVPGAIVVALTPVRPGDGAVRLAFTSATSLLSLMTLAVAADYGLPLVGIDDPLARLPFLVIVDVASVLVLLVAARRRDPLEVLIGPRVPTPAQIMTALAIGSVPIAAAAGAQQVHNGRGSSLALVALVAAGVLLIGVLVAAERLAGWVVRAGLYAVAVAVIWSSSLSSDRLFGWDIQQEFQAFSATVNANAWHPIVGGDPYRAMLSITALPAVLANLTGMSGESLLRGVYPLLFASFPVLVYVVAARWLPKTASFAAAGFVVAQLAFAQQLPAIARQEVALMFFGVLVAIAFDDGLEISHRRIVVALAGASLALTHYSTAYVTALVLVTAWLIGSVVRLVHRRARPPRVFVAWVVLAILGCTVAWNVGVTSSSDNVLRFTEQVAERGPEFLPSGDGRSLIGRWLSGNAPQRISGEEYGRRVELIYDATAPWLNGYPDDQVAEFPVTNADTPRVITPLPRAREAQAMLVVLVSQGLAALTALGILVFGWQRRRDWSSARELATVGVALLGFVAAMRVSGVAAEAYNQERAQIHAAAILSVGFAASIAWFLVRWRRMTTIVLSAALTVLFLTSSGLAARLMGGDPSSNLSDSGDTRERFAVTDAEVASVRWLAANRRADSLVYTDRYGKLRIWAAAVPIGGSSLQDVLTPATLDQNAYVFASEANTIGGRARGAIGPDFAVYAFPEAFLDAHKAVIYSTGSTRIYR